MPAQPGLTSKWFGTEHLVTSRGPQDIVPFVRALKDHFAAGAPLVKKTLATQSAPQADQPPKVVLGFMKALPVPKFKTLLTLGAIAAGVYALKNSRSIRTQLNRAA